MNSAMSFANFILTNIELCVPFCPCPSQTEKKCWWKV